MANEEQEFQRRGSIIGDGPLNPQRDIGRIAQARFKSVQQRDPMQAVLRDQIYETHIPLFRVTAAVQYLLPASPYRRTYLLIQNLDAALSCFLGFGAQPAVNAGIELIAKGNYEPWKIPQGDIFIVCAGVLNVSLLYGSE